MTCEIRFRDFEAGSGSYLYTLPRSQLVNDIFLGNLTYYNRINERSAIAASLRYFSLGDIRMKKLLIRIP